MNPIARVTIRATGERFSVYSVPGSQGSYPVWVAATGYACHCPCKARTFNPHKRCRHMLRLQQWLDGQRRTAPLARKEFALLMRACHHKRHVLRASRFCMAATENTRWSTQSRRAIISPESRKEGYYAHCFRVYRA